MLYWRAAQAGQRKLICGWHAIRERLLHKHAHTKSERKKEMIERFLAEKTKLPKQSSKLQLTPLVCARCIT